MAIFTTSYGSAMTRLVCEPSKLAGVQELKSVFSLERFLPTSDFVLLLVVRALTCGAIIVQRTLLPAICVVLMAQILSAASIYDYQLTTIDYETVHLHDFKRQSSANRQCCKALWVYSPICWA